WSRSRRTSLQRSAKSSKPTFLPIRRRASSYSSRISGLATASKRLSAQAFKMMAGFPRHIAPETTTLVSRTTRTPPHFLDSLLHFASLEACFLGVAVAVLDQLLEGRSTRQHDGLHEQIDSVAEDHELGAF